MSALQPVGALNPSKWKPAKTLRLAVSGDVELSALEIRICDTPAFQRLRRLKQLGFSYLVYPSAQHTRFEHALGSVQKARRMVEAVRLNPQSDGDARKVPDDDYLLIRLAALLHDVGNLPFGHTLEDEGCVIAEQQEDNTRLERFMGENTEIGKILSDGIGEDGRRSLLGILTSKQVLVDGQTVVRGCNGALGEHAYIADIVKNTVCADLLDYLERDSYHCNLNISVGDRFMRYLYLTPHKGAKRLAIRLWKGGKDDRPRPDLLSELTFLLEARYHIAERVYFHHARTATSAMITRAVYAALQIQGPRKLTIEKMYDMGDEDLLNWLVGCDAPLANQMAKMLRERRLYKRVDQVEREVVEHDKRHGRLNEMDNKFRRNPAKRVEIEDEIADLCGLQSGDILVYCPDPGMNLKAAEMLVTWRDDVKPLKEVDDPVIQNRTVGIVNSHRNLWQCKVFIGPGRRATGEVMRRVKDVANCHLRGDGVYSRETIEQVLHELAEEQNLRLFISDIREVADSALAPAHGGASLTKQSLRSELQSYVERKRPDSPSRGRAE